MIRRPIRPAKYSLDVELDDIKFCVVEFLDETLASEVIIYSGSEVKEMLSPIPVHAKFWTRDLKIYYNKEILPVYAIYFFDTEVEWPLIDGISILEWQTEKIQKQVPQLNLEVPEWSIEYVQSIKPQMSIPILEYQIEVVVSDHPAKEYVYDPQELVYNIFAGKLEFTVESLAPVDINISNITIDSFYEKPELQSMRETAITVDSFYEKSETSFVTRITNITVDVFYTLEFPE